MRFIYVTACVIYIHRFIRLSVLVGIAVTLWGRDNWQRDPRRLIPWNLLVPILTTHRRISLALWGTSRYLLISVLPLPSGVNNACIAHDEVGWTNVTLTTNERFFTIVYIHVCLSFGGVDLSKTDLK